jgi:DNA-binding NtrC family response regulator
VDRMTHSDETPRPASDWRNFGQPAALRDMVLLQPGLAFSRQLLEAFRKEGWNPCVATNRQEAQRLLRLKRIHAGVVLIGAPIDATAQTELAEVMAESPGTEWIAIVDTDCVDLTAMASFLRDFFYDFHTAPIDMERLAYTLGHAYGAARLGEVAHSGVRKDVHSRYGLIGSHPLMQQVFSDIEKISRCDESVFITGETGTGKELVARAIHGRSERALQPFVAVNCGAIPDTLVQSELFGYVKGAFTGAVESRIGHLQAADGGTVFLDGIEDLSPLGQVSLLRFLQDRAVTPVGGKDSLPVNVRVMASAGPSYKAALAQGSIRQDLFYRLNVLQIDVPPLRDRGEDAVEIAHDVIDRFNRQRKTEVRRLGRSALERIREYPWPGNVRELVASVNRAAMLADGRQIGPADLGLPGTAKYKGRTLREIKSRAVEQALISALTETRNISSAARYLGVSRVTLYRLMDKHAIRTPAMAENEEAMILNQKGVGPGRMGSAGH